MVIKESLFLLLLSAVSIEGIERKSYLQSNRRVFYQPRPQQINQWSGVGNQGGVYYPNQTPYSNQFPSNVGLPQTIIVPPNGGFPPTSYTPPPQISDRPRIIIIRGNQNPDDVINSIMRPQPQPSYPPYEETEKYIYVKPTPPPTRTRPTRAPIVRPRVTLPPRTIRPRPAIEWPTNPPRTIRPIPTAPRTIRPQTPQVRPDTTFQPRPHSPQPTQTASEINAQINHLLGGNIPNERVAPQPAVRPQPRPLPIGGLVRPPPGVLVRPRPRPQAIGGPVPKPATRGEHPQNYCNRGVYSDEQLAGLSLQRIDYFVVNNSCSHEFFKCAIGNTFKERCSTTTQAFDRSTVNCNFKYNVKYCPEYDHVLHCSIKEQCTAAQFACCSHPQQCIPISERCDGVPNCVDGADENNCPSCNSDEFPCVKECPASKFQCASLAGTRTPCIDMQMRCNGIRDCPNGEDETNCKVKGPKFLLCENQKKSVPKERWCDGKNDCGDGSDEKYCFW